MAICNDVILTPHWRASNPHVDEGNFSVLQTSGIYNAGFIGVNKNAIPAMEWWSNVCEFKCKKAPGKGFFADQAYLDLLPVYFDRVKVIRHKGCNVANWNQVECRRSPSTKGKVKINNQWDVVFIHFTQSTINGILYGEDGLLKPYLEEYQASLERFKGLNKVYHQEKSSQSVANKSKNTPLLPDESLSDDNFISPAFTHENLDRFIIRSSIITSLKQYLPNLSGVMLDVGCGEMPYKAFFTSTNSNVEKYIGLDLEANPIHNNQPDITWQDGVIPLEDNSIDCAICTEVLEHCPDPEAILSEVCRVLKPGGFFFFTVPFLWPLHEVPYDEYRYTPYSLNRHLSNSGFVDIKLKSMGGWDASMAQMLGLWVRRRSMRRWLRKTLSLFIMPIVYILIRKKNMESTFHEGLMITGISGFAYKKG
jgi:SAM-dependent methyltransferase